MTAAEHAREADLLLAAVKAAADQPVVAGVENIVPMDLVTRAQAHALTALALAGTAPVRSGRGITVAQLG